MKYKLNEELNIHDKRVATEEIEDLAMPSIPEEVELFINEDISIISKEEVGNRSNEQGGGWGIKTWYDLWEWGFFSANVGPRFQK